MLCDENEWYEATYPFVQVGNTEFLKDKDFSVPEAKTTTVTNVSDDSLTVSTKTLRSGKYGNWNEFKGHFTIRREKNEWYAEVIKYNSEGEIEKTLPSEVIKSDKFPVGDLNHIICINIAIFSLICCFSPFSFTSCNILYKTSSISKSIWK